MLIQHLKPKKEWLPYVVPFAGSGIFGSVFGFAVGNAAAVEVLATFLATVFGAGITVAGAIYAVHYQRTDSKRGKAMRASEDIRRCQVNAGNVLVILDLKVYEGGIKNENIREMLANVFSEAVSLEDIYNESLHEIFYQLRSARQYAYMATINSAKEEMVISALKKVDSILWDARALLKPLGGR